MRTVLTPEQSAKMKQAIESGTVPASAERQPVRITVKSPTPTLERVLQVAFFALCLWGLLSLLTYLL